VRKIHSSIMLLIKNFNKIGKEKKVIFRLRLLICQLIGSIKNIDCSKKLPVQHRVGLIDCFKRVKLIKSYRTFELVEKELRKHDKSYYLVIFILLLNSIRFGFYTFAPDDEQILKYSGDLHHYYGGRRQLLVIPFCLYTVLAFQFLLKFNYCKIDQLEWFKIFGVINGLEESTFSKIGIYDERLAKRLIILSSWILLNANVGIVDFLSFGFLLNFNLANDNQFGLDFFLVGIPVVIINSVWVFYAAGVCVCSLTSCHHLLLP